MRTKRPFARSTPRALTLLGIGGLCVAASFAAGMQTSGRIEPFAQSEAAIIGAVERREPGLQDVIAILEVAQGYREATREELQRNDTDGNGALDARDALRILHVLIRR